MNRNIYLFIKRLFDILGSLIGCICLLPLMLVVKVCNMCTKDFSSMFYKQKRIAKIGKFLRTTSLDETPQFINQVCYL